MRTYVLLLRGINVGGTNKVPMAQLRACLSEQDGITDVATLIASGNVVLRSSLSAAALQQLVEQLLPERFQLTSKLVRVLVLTSAQFRAVVDDKPAGFGEQPDTYHSDVIFLLGITPTQALQVFNPREGVDEIWTGRGVIYSQRLSAERTKSRLGAIAGTPVYPSLTIRNWNTTTRIVRLLDERERASDPSARP